MKYSSNEIEQTKIEINNMLDCGMNLLTVNEFKSELKRLFNLKLCLDSNNYLLKYYNTSNKQHYLCATTTAIDKTGYSWCNINGVFYKENCLKQSSIYKQLQQWRLDNFCILKTGHILTL